MIGALVPFQMTALYGEEPLVPLRDEKTLLAALHLPEIAREIGKPHTGGLTLL